MFVVILVLIFTPEISLFLVEDVFFGKGRLAVTNDFRSDTGFVKYVEEEKSGTCKVDFFGIIKNPIAQIKQMRIGIKNRFIAKDVLRSVRFIFAG